MLTFVPEDDIDDIDDILSFTVISINFYQKQTLPWSTFRHSCLWNYRQASDRLSWWKSFWNWWKLVFDKSNKRCITMELVWVKGLILLKVTTAKNLRFVTTSFVIMDSSFKIMFVMVAMIWCYFLIYAILLLSLSKILNIVALNITDSWY